MQESHSFRSVVTYWYENCNRHYANYDFHSFQFNIYMKRTLIFILAGAMITACQKSVTDTQDQQQQPQDQHNPRSVSDTLMVYSIQNANGKSSIVTKSMATGTVTTVATDGFAPFASNIRMVFIKDGNTLAFGKLDGVSRALATLTQPIDPTLSVDSKVVCLVDKGTTTYQLLTVDTLGNKSVLYETANRICHPTFSSDGQKIAFVEFVTPRTSDIVILTLSSKTVHRVTNPGADFYDNYCTITDQTIYFVRSRSIDSTLSSEIYSCDFNGGNLKQLTSYTGNWSKPSFFISDLRKVSNSIDSSSIVCISNYGGNTDVYLYKIGGSLSPLTQNTDVESYPNYIANYVKPN